MMDEVRIGKYRHYKGNYYEVLGIARHSETLEELVVYRALYEVKEPDGNPFWARPKKGFMENITVGEKEVPRFKFVE